VLGCVEYGHASEHCVLTTTETGEHVPRFLNVSGFAEDLLVEHDDRIRSQHHRGGELLCDVLGFGVSYPHGVSPWDFVGQRAFIDIGRDNGKRYGQLRQQFPTPWRG
jgi:hypothetical protein